MRNIDSAEKMTLRRVYLAWLTNKITIRSYADEHGLTFEEAETVIKLGGTFTSEESEG